MTCPGGHDWYQISWRNEETGRTESCHVEDQPSHPGYPLVTTYYRCARPGCDATTTRTHDTWLESRSKNKAPA